MGSLIARFRKQPSTIEVLEKIEKDISSIQRFRLRNQQQQKNLIASLILYSILMYIVSALVFFFYYFPAGWKNRILYSTPLLVFPVLIWLLKKVLHWYFVKRITKNDFALNELRQSREQILEDVMEKETYKKAREILQKFDPAKFRELETPAKQASKVASPQGSTVRQRTTSASKASPQSRMNTPGMRGNTPRPGPSGARFPAGTMTPNVPRQGMHPRALMTPINNGMTPAPPLPRPVLPRERSKMDRMLEYLVGDGPQNRYALICKYCHSHNGMAMKEEFEYLSFRCCYCYQMNLARKQRPFAPKLDTVTPSRPDMTSRPQGPNTGVRPNKTDDTDDTGDEKEDRSDESDFEKISDTDDGENIVTTENISDKNPPVNTITETKAKPQEPALAGAQLQQHNNAPITANPGPQTKQQPVNTLNGQ